MVQVTGLVQKTRVFYLSIAEICHAKISSCNQIHAYSLHKLYGRITMLKEATLIECCKSHDVSFNNLS